VQHGVVLVTHGVEVGPPLHEPADQGLDLGDLVWMLRFFAFVIPLRRPYCVARGHQRRLVGVHALLEIHAVLIEKLDGLQPSEPACIVKHRGLASIHDRMMGSVPASDAFPDKVFHILEPVVGDSDHHPLNRIA
jgi:hypothetical protein